MNCLAHIYLSGNNPDVTIGNFIADHVKGKDLLKYPEGIRKGMLLHRAIDNFTDNHPIVEKTKQRIRASQKKYTPVVTDIYYDHYLAANWKLFSEIDIEVFADNFYKLTDNFIDVMPARTINMLKYMREQNWLVNYAAFNGLQRVFNGMSTRVNFENNMVNAVNDLHANYKQISNEFFEFFEDLRKFAVLNTSSF